MKKDPKFEATMLLPKDGKAKWSEIMYGEVPVKDRIDAYSPIVAACAVFSDGTQVIGGVYKSNEPTEYNCKFMWVFDADGNQYDGWHIDVSDEEDFYTEGYLFNLNEEDEEEYPDGKYLLNIKEL